MPLLLSRHSAIRPRRARCLILKVRNSPPVAVRTCPPTGPTCAIASYANPARHVRDNVPTTRSLSSR